MGRPRKNGDRYPSGKLKPPPNLEYLGEVAPTEVRRIADHARDLAIDRRLAGEVGRLLLIGQLSTLEAAVAWRIGEIYGRYERFACRRRSTPSASYEMGARSTGDGEEPIEAAAAARDAWHAVQDFIREKWPVKVFSSPKLKGRMALSRSNHVRLSLEALCVDDRNIGPSALYEMRAVLQRIASEHFEIVRAVKKQKVAPPPPSAATLRQLRTSDFGRDLQVLFEVGAQAAHGDVPIPADANERVSEVIDFFTALKEREKFRGEKKRTRSNTPRTD